MTKSIIRFDFTDEGLSNMGIIRLYRNQILLNQEIIKKLEKLLDSIKTGTNNNFLGEYRIADMIKDELGLKK